MPKALICDRCGQSYTDTESIESAQRDAESWREMCRADGDEARGICPCPMIRCAGEMTIEEG